MVQTPSRINAALRMCRSELKVHVPLESVAGAGERSGDACCTCNCYEDMMLHHRLCWNFGMRGSLSCSFLAPSSVESNLLRREPRVFKAKRIPEWIDVPCRQLWCLASAAGAAGGKASHNIPGWVMARCQSVRSTLPKPWLPSK